MYPESGAIAATSLLAVDWGPVGLWVSAAIALLVTSSLTVEAPPGSEPRLELA